jgi:prepilin signal peptidase PulO-like enzyme (type II secretory pathway)
MTPAGWQSISRLGITLLAAFLVGLATGRIALAFAVVLAVYGAVQLWNLLRFEHWLRRRRIEEPPDISGLWGEVVAIVSRIYRRKQFHRARVTALLRDALGAVRGVDAAAIARAAMRNARDSGSGGPHGDFIGAALRRARLAALRQWKRRASAPGFDGHARRARRAKVRSGKRSSA